ncbi:MAG: hypothetical protein ACHQ7N_07125 [Candidatus Methylomirabilales bacterium]
MARAIVNLRQARVLTPRALATLATSRLARLIRPSGYYRTKAVRVKRFVRFLEARYRLDLSRMFAERASGLRSRTSSWTRSPAGSSSATASPVRTPCTTRCRPSS